jgi:hypothetical protein
MPFPSVHRHPSPHLYPGSAGVQGGSHSFGAAALGRALRGLARSIARLVQPELAREGRS